MELSDDSDVVAGVRIDRDNSFDAELKVLPRPNDSWINGSGGWTGHTVNWGLHRELDERNKAFERSAQTDVFHVLLQINQTILDGDPPFKTVGYSFAFDT